MGWLLWLVIPAGAAPVSLSAADGASLAGEGFGKGARGVLLVHDEDRSRADFASLAPRLAAAGYHVLALDLRGHGASTLPAPLAEDDWSELIGDVEAGVGWLQARGATEVHLVGAGLGANLVLNAASRSALPGGLVLLSPSLNVHGVRVSGAISTAGDRPLLLVASLDDPLSVRAATWLRDQATGPAQVTTYPEGGSGAGLLASAPDLDSLVLGWLTSAGPAGAGAAAERGALRSEVGDIETTGTRIEERQR